MADLSETPDWTAGIYQLETSDPVLAGPDGIDNLQAKQLANRTLWLKTQLQQLADNLANLDGLQPLDATLTALAALQTVADRMIYTTGPDAFATTALTAFARQLLAAVDQAAARTVLGAAPLDSPTFTGAPKVPTAALGTNTLQAASTAFVQLTVAALVNSSPDALNTLNELAAALGNDPNFAATVMNALAGKQALLGFTPIQQGGGANQGANKLRIGWGADGALRLQVDSTDFGSAWPIKATLSGAPAVASLGPTSGWWKDTDTGLIRQYIIVNRGDTPSNHSASNEFSVTWPMMFPTAALYANVTIRSNVKGSAVANVAGEYDLGVSSGNFYIEEWSGGVQNISVVIEVVGN